MKKLLLILCLFLAFNSYSQTTTKKYNDLKNRYEYYQNGRMIGYEKYNSLRDQWEYYSTQSSQSTSSYSDPVSTFDADLAMKVLQYKQNRYDNERAVVDKNMARLSELKKQISEHVYNINNTDKRDQIIELYKKRYTIYTDRAFPTKEDFYHTIKSYDLTTAMINNILEIYNRTWKEILNNNVSYSSSNNSNNNIQYTTIIEPEIPVSPKLRNKPSPNGGVIYKPKKGERVDVFEKITDRYYRVKINGYYGYIAKTFIK